MMELFISRPYDSKSREGIDVDINVSIRAFLIVLNGLNASNVMILFNAHVPMSMVLTINLMNHSSCLMIVINSCDGLEIRLLYGFHLHL